MIKFIFPEMSMGATEKAFKNFNFSQNFTLVRAGLMTFAIIILLLHVFSLSTHWLKLQRFSPWLLICFLTVCVTYLILLVESSLLMSFPAFQVV